MRWFRDKIGQGAWLALMALVINLGLSFGHVHPIEAKGSDRGLISLLAAAKSTDRQTQGDSDKGQPDFCLICMAASAMASPLASAPPALPVEFAVVTIDGGIEPVLAVAEPPAAAFRSRAPPIS